MTNEEKERITRLRAAGMGYKRIACELSLPLTTIKSFCQRSGLPVPETAFKQEKCENTAYSQQSAADSSVCKQCGQHIEQFPGRKPKRFCCDACRMKWWRSHKDQMKHKVHDTRICAGCGVTFEIYGADERKYCSRACYSKYRFRDARI